MRAPPARSAASSRTRSWWGSTTGPRPGADGDQGDLYGLGNAGGVYVVNAHNAKASLVSRLDVALEGTSFGVDFNPTVDRLRVISDTGQNLRANVDTGATLVDGRSRTRVPR